MKNSHALLILLLSSAIALPARAEEGLFSVASDERIVSLPYDASDVYTIITKYGYQTSLVFARDEQIETISMGDRSLWQIIPSGQRLFIRPMDDDVITNMTIITNRRSYQFDLKSLPADSKEKPLYVVSFTYPDAKKKESPPEFSPPAPAGFTPDSTFTSRPAAIASGTSNYKYTYTGPDELAPLKVFDDGQSTFFHYRSLSNPAPRVFAVEAGKPERELTSYVQGNDLVINETGSQFILREAGGSITVYNETLNPK